jgi:hypothetical protein
MNVYVYQAALLCEPCGESAQHGLEPDEDSDRYPIGPIGQGGGEADCPQHCDRCFVFLRNPLTGDGYEYVRRAIAKGGGSRKWPEVVSEWAEFYELDD